MPSLPAGRVTNDAANYYAVALQSAKDIDGTTFYYTKHLDGSGFDVTVDQSSERQGGGGKEIALRYRTKVTADGQVVQYCQPDGTGRELYAALGTDAITASAGGVYTHSLNSGASQLPYRTMEQNWADETERVSNAVTKSLKFEGEAGHPVKMTTQFVTGGTAHTQSTLLTPSRESAFPVMVPGGSVAVTIGQNLTNGLGASSLQVTKWSVEVVNDLDDAIQTTSLFREDVLWRNVDYNIDLTVKYISKALWEAVQYGGGTQVPTGLLSAGSFNFYSQQLAGPSTTNQGLALYAPFLELPGLKVNRLDPDGKTMYLDASGMTRNIGTQSLQATVWSLASTAYSLTTT